MPDDGVPVLRLAAAICHAGIEAFPLPLPVPTPPPLRFVDEGNGDDGPLGLWLVGVGRFGVEAFALEAVVEEEEDGNWYAGAEDAPYGMGVPFVA